MKKEVTLLDILQLLRKRWWIILVCGILLAGIIAAYSVVSYEPTYTSSVSVIVNSASGDQDQFSVSDDVSQATWALKVVKNYMEILKSYDFMEAIAERYEELYPEEWERQSYEAQWLQNSLAFSATDDTTTFTVSVTSKNAEDSCRIGEIFGDLAPERISDITGKDAIEIYGTSRPATKPSNSKNLTRNTIMGFLIGAVLSFVVVFTVDVFDARIKSEEDIASNYPFPLLGSIPNFEIATKKRKGYGYSYGKK